jgi:hypothetical protein
VATVLLALLVAEAVEVLVKLVLLVHLAVTVVTDYLLQLLVPL